MLSKKPAIHKQQVEKINMPPKVSKPVAKDIWLEKEPELINGDIFYRFTLVAKTSKIVNFEADFKGSERVQFHNEHLETDNNAFFEPIKSTILPDIDKEDHHIGEVRKVLTVIKLEKNNWKLKSKFKFTFSNLPKDQQKKLIKAEVEALNRALK